VPLDFVRIVFHKTSSQKHGILVAKFSIRDRKRFILLFLLTQKLAKLTNCLKIFRQHIADAIAEILGYPEDKITVYFLRTQTFVIIIILAPEIIAGAGVTTRATVS